MKEFICGPRALISTDALRHNLGVVRKVAPASRVLAVIKANGYGHGIVQTARALREADAFGVARIQEGLALRRAGSTHAILLLEGVFNANDLEVAAKENFALVVHTFDQLEMLEAWSGTHRFEVWVKIDTGMHRLGFALDQFAQAWSRINRCAAVAAGVRLMTHLASAEAPDSAETKKQLEAFAHVTAGLAADRSIANSAATLGLANVRGDWVRPGVMLYGISPFAQQHGTQLGLRPAMTLETNLIAIHDVAKGQAVGYGGKWHAERATRIGIAAAGYGDGYPRHVRNGAPVVIGDRTALIAGRVSMDMINIDLSGTPNAQIGDAVQLWGAQLPVESIADFADTIPYELVCGISQRVQVEYR
jgi:alanine racemase